MRRAFKDRPFTYGQGEDGLWSAIDQRLGIGAIARTKEAAYDKVCALVFERLKEMSDEELQAHLDGCEVVMLDDQGNMTAGPGAGLPDG